MPDYGKAIHNADLLLEATCGGMDKIKERNEEYFPDVDFKTRVAFATIVAASDVKDLQAVFGNNLIDIDQHSDWDLTEKEEKEIYNEYGLKEIDAFEEDRWFAIQLDEMRRVEVFWNDNYSNRGWSKIFLFCPQKEIYKYDPDRDSFAIHPGIFLLKAFVIPKKFNIESLAKDLKMPTDKFVSLLKGRRPFPDGISDSLAKIFKTTQLFWNELNDSYTNHSFVSQNYRELHRLARKYHKR